MASRNALGWRDGPRPRTPGQSGRRRHPSEEAKTLLEEGASVVIFWGGGTLFLLGVLVKTGGWTWFFGGEVVVDCW